mgnify:CR=1 FL=1
MITVRDLSWQYEPLVDGGKPVDSLKHVSFDIKSGSFVGVIGPTGAGKSTCAWLWLESSRIWRTAP